MTLIDKFNKATAGWIVPHACEEIADDYAVEFADWLIKRQINYFESLTELLKVFKKEKGYEANPQI